MMAVTDNEPSMSKLYFSTKDNFGFTYSTPLVVISGVNNLYPSNNEQQSTYSWILLNFKEVLGKEPRVIYSDGDLSLGSAIGQIFPDVEHRLCSWHLARNLSRKFSYLGPKRNWLICLIYIRSDKNVEEIKKYLKDQELRTIFHLRQWARCYHHPVFDADIITTSRVESWNSVIAFIEFIQSIEPKKYSAMYRI